MKKSLIMAAAVFTFCGLNSCQKDDNPGPNGPVAGEVSKNVLEAFAAKYPGATNVRWNVKGDYAVANFYLDATRAEADGNNHAAWFGNLDGEWAMTETNIPLTALPQAVQQGFAQSKYYGEPWQLTQKCDKLERRDVVLLDGAEGTIVVYVIGVTKTEEGVTTTMDLYFSADGVLVNEVVDAPNDGYEDYIPQKPAASIEGYLKEHYPDARVVDIDMEYGGTEVELSDGKHKLELFFDASQNWIYTKTKFGSRRLSEVPYEILEALKTSPHFTSEERIDEIEKLETNEKNGGKTYWCFELETRWDEVDVYVDAAEKKIVDRPQLDMGDSGSSAPAGDVEKFIAQKYPGARITDRDKSDGYLEVEIWHDNKEKEVKFNGRNEWVRTEWEIRSNELPAAVTDAISKGGYSLGDDEADVVETPSGKWYEVEVRKGREEYKLWIDESGKILRTERDD